MTQFRVRRSPSGGRHDTAPILPLEQPSGALAWTVPAGLLALVLAGYVVWRIWG